MKIKAINKYRFSLIEDIKSLLKSKFQYKTFTFEKGDIYVEITHNDELIISSLKSIEFADGINTLRFKFYNSMFLLESLLEDNNFDLELPDETLSYIKNILISEKATS
jgi:hypothetical protein